MDCKSVMHFSRLYPQILMQGNRPIENEKMFHAEKFSGLK